MLAAVPCGARDAARKRRQYFLQNYAGSGRGGRYWLGRLEAITVTGVSR
jgi:hypothetical protein